MRLFVQFPSDSTVLVDGEARGRTNSEIPLAPGRHRVAVDWPHGTEPAEHEVVVADGSDPLAPRVVAFVPGAPPLTRFSPLYNRYNGFMLGQFLALAFAEYARADYAVRRARMQEFLSEIDVDVTLPREPLAYGSEEYQQLFTSVVSAIGEPELARFAFLGMALVHYPYLKAGNDPLADRIADLVAGIVDQYALPAIDLDALVPEVTDPLQIRADDVLSPALRYLGEVVDTLDVEPDTAFVIMPFAPPFAGFFASLYRPALEAAGLRAFRAWGGLSDEDYCDLLLKLIRRSGLVLADVSDGNANVHYEIGAAHAFGRPAILLAHEDARETIPANIGHDTVVTYSPSSAGFPERAGAAITVITQLMRVQHGRTGRARVAPSSVRKTLETLGEDLSRRIIPAEARAARREAEQLREAGELERAERAYDDAIALGLNDWPSHGGRALVRIHREDWAGAVGDLSEALADAPPETHGDLLRLRAASHSQLGDYAHAEADYTAALSSEPVDEETLALRGAVRLALGRAADAAADLDAAARQGVDTLDLHCNAVLAWVRAGDVARAEAALREAERVAPDDAAVATCRGELLLAQSKPDDAVAAFREAASRDDSASRLLDVAIGLACAGQCDDARAVFDEASADAAPDAVRDAVNSIEFWRERYPQAAALAAPAAGA